MNIIFTFINLKGTHIQMHIPLVLFGYAKETTPQSGLGLEKTKGNKEISTTKVILENMLHKKWSHSYMDCL